MLERRPAAAADGAFLRTLYATSRPDVAAWEDDARETFLDLQFLAREQDWRSRYQASIDELIVLDGRPVGRVWIAWLTDECRILDIAVLPECRRRGIGTHVVADTLGQADRRGVCVRLTVERLNEAAQAFWARAGFVPVAADDLYLELERPVNLAHRPRASG